MIIDMKNKTKLHTCEISVHTLLCINVPALYASCYSLPPASLSALTAEKVRQTLLELWLISVFTSISLVQSVGLDVDQMGVQHVEESRLLGHGPPGLEKTGLGGVLRLVRVEGLTNPRLEERVQAVPDSPHLLLLLALTGLGVLEASRTFSHERLNRTTADQVRDGEERSNSRADGQRAFAAGRLVVAAAEVLTNGL